LQAIDEALLGSLFGFGEAFAFWRVAARELTAFGGSAILVPLSLAVAAGLALGGHRRRAAGLLLITLVGRLLVEGVKLALARPRPALFDHQVAVTSLSFPSGHAANATIVYLTLALVVAPLLTSRRWPVPAALALAAFIGLTRPVLGVHWPSDVLGGWTMGLAWTLAAVRLLGPWMEGRSFNGPPRAT